MKSGRNFTKLITGFLIGLACTMGGAFVAFAESTTNPATDRLALVIGVADYQHWPKHSYALRNARQVRRTLEASGYKVTLLQDPSAAELKSAFDRLAHSEGQITDRSIVVYYCGRAKSQILNDGTHMGWILPKDCPEFNPDPGRFSHSAISTRMLANLSRQIRTRHLIMLFDTAFDADLFNLQAPKISRFNPTALLPARQFIVAGGANQSVPEDSTFTDAFAQALSGQADMLSDSYVTGTELAVFMANRLSQATKGRLNLQYGQITTAHSLSGDFFFHPTKPNSKGTLYVKCQPKDTRIKILNIKPKFHQGIQLAPGSYTIEMSADGHITRKKKIIINTNQVLRIQLKLDKSKHQIANNLGMTFRWIEGGRFRMGSPVDEPGRLLDEQRHWVTLAHGFWMQTHEVTVGQFTAFIDHTGYITDAQKSGGCWSLNPGGRWQRRSNVSWDKAGPWLNAKGKAKADLPVTCISWNDAEAFARWLSDREGKLYSLPTEEQWEVACRAGTSAPFAFGRCLQGADANFAQQGLAFNACQPHQSSSAPQLLRSGRRTENKWGLSDMHGNAAEWCLNLYRPYGRIGSELPSQGQLRSAERIIRGGHFASSADQCRSASRSSFKPGLAANVIGFRLTQRP